MAIRDPSGATTASSAELLRIRTVLSRPSSEMETMARRWFCWPPARLSDQVVYAI